MARRWRCPQCSKLQPHYTREFGGVCHGCRDEIYEACHLAAVTAEPPPQPLPDAPAVWDLVVADMRARDQMGTAKYGTRLQPGNGRDALADAYQEALDLAVYLRQALYERDGR